MLRPDVVSLHSSREDCAIYGRCWRTNTVRECMKNPVRNFDEFVAGRWRNRKIGIPIISHGTRQRLLTQHLHGKQDWRSSLHTAFHLNIGTYRCLLFRSESNLETVQLLLFDKSKSLNGQSFNEARQNRGIIVNKHFGETVTGYGVEVINRKIINEEVSVSFVLPNKSRANCGV